MNANELEWFLRERVRNAKHGERLPPVRTLMREYGVGQAAIQGVFNRMAHQGQLSLRVGRGTFVQKMGQARSSLDGATVLVLSLRLQTERSHAVARQLHGQLSELGVRCIQLVYERLDEALEVLRLNARFDACVLQSYFETVPLGLLAFLRERCGGLVVDGARLAGMDVDAIASDWRGAMDKGALALRHAGHERIGFVAWPGGAQPLEGLRHHFCSLRQWLGRDEVQMPLIALERMPRPGESSAELIRAGLDKAGHGRRGAVTALMVWAGSDGDGIARALDGLSLQVPRDLSVLLLGHVNRADEHIHTFDIVGSNSDAAAAALVACVRQRIEQPQSEHQTIYLENHLVSFGSIGAPASRPRPG